MDFALPKISDFWFVAKKDPQSQPAASDNVQ